VQVTFVHFLTVKSNGGLVTTEAECVVMLTIAALQLGKIK
jgi:hypothetical protein